MDFAPNGFCRLASAVWLLPQGHTGHAAALAMRLPWPFGRSCRAAALALRQPNHEIDEDADGETLSASFLCNIVAV